MRRQLVSGLFQMLCTWLWTSCVASMWTSFFVALGASVTHHGDLDSLGKLAEAVLVLLCMECPFQYLSLREDCCWDVKNSADACLQLLRHGPYKHGSYMITFMLFFLSGAKLWRVGSHFLDSPLGALFQGQPSLECASEKNITVYILYSGVGGNTKR